MPMISPMNDDDERKRRIVPDGGRVYVPLMARDSAMHRPGVRTLDTVDYSAADAAYLEMKRRNCEAWRSPAQVDADREAACETARIEVMAQDDAEKIRDAAWRAMCRRNENAWKNPT
jgi:hypothetical protein